MKTFTKHYFLQPFNTNTLVFSAMFISLNIIFTHVLAIQTPFIRISFGYLPIALFCALFGPMQGGIIAAIADILGCLIFSSGLYFPGFTLSAYLSGIIYGYFFYHKKVSIQRIIMANILIFIFIDLMLNTLWLSILYHKAAQVFFAGRFIKCSILLPIQILTIYAVYRSLLRHKIFNIVNK